MPTNPQDAFKGQSRSGHQIQYHLKC